VSNSNDRDRRFQIERAWGACAELLFMARIGFMPDAAVNYA
jgi:hypothetical protein